MTNNNQINALYAQYNLDCEDIAVQCVEEGYPAYGSNYDLRCASLWEEYYLPEIEYLENKLEEKPDGVDTPRKPSTRAERRKATARAKAKNQAKAKALGMNSPWKEPTHSKWIDPYLKHHVSAGDWRLALKGKATSKARRAEDKGVIREYLNEDTYGVFIDEDWEQAWKEHDEAEYWEAIEASEYEDMRTFEEVRAYYDD